MSPWRTRVTNRLWLLHSFICWKNSKLEKEELACIFGIIKFYCYFYWRLVTDHKPLTTWFAEDKPIPPQASGWIQCCGPLLGMYHLVYKSGSAHGNADALSHPPLTESKLTSTQQSAETILLFQQLQDGPLTFYQIRSWTRWDPILSRVSQSTPKGWLTGSIQEYLKPYWHKHLKLSCHDGRLLWGSRVVVPKAGQLRVLKELHKRHPRSTCMKQIARTMVLWTGIDQNMAQTVKSCTLCQNNQSLPPSLSLLPWRSSTRH